MVLNQHILLNVFLVDEDDSTRQDEHRAKPRRGRSGKSKDGREEGRKGVTDMIVDFNEVSVAGPRSSTHAHFYIFLLR